MDSVVKLEEYDLPLFTIEYYSSSIFLEGLQINDYEKYQNIIDSEWLQWQCLTEFIKRNRKEDCVVIICGCIDDFSTIDRSHILSQIIASVGYDAKVLLGNSAVVNLAVPLTSNLFWIDKFESCSFMVFYKSFFSEIFKLKRGEFLGVSTSLNNLTSQKLLIFPFIDTSTNNLYNDGVDRLKELRNIAFELYYPLGEAGLS